MPKLLSKDSKQEAVRLYRQAGIIDDMGVNNTALREENASLRQTLKAVL